VVLASQQPGKRLTNPDLDIEPGDELAFFDRLNGELLARQLVVSARRSGRQTEVTLAGPVPPIKLGTGRDNPALEITQVYNLSRACGNFAFRHNAFVRGRRIGILAKSGPGLIEHNQFVELGAGGVEIWNAPFEGLHGHHILVRNNLFDGGGLVYRRRGPPPAIWSQMFGAEPSKRLHTHLQILDNRIVDYRGNGIELRDAEQVIVAGNIFEQRHVATLRDPQAANIRLGNVYGALVSGNVFADARFTADRQVAVEQSSAVEVVP
jgi:hypothetical protein